MPLRFFGTHRESTVAKKATATTAAPQASPEPNAGQSPKIDKAAEAVRRAEAELEKAKLLYQDLRQQTAEKIQAAREATVGDLMDGALKVVKKHPGPGILVAAIIGFFLGRLFRR